MALIPLSHLQDPWYTTRFCTTKHPHLENPRMTLLVWRAPTAWRPAYLLATTLLAHLKGELQLSREPSVLPPFPWRRVTPPNFPINVFSTFSQNSSQVVSMTTRASIQRVTLFFSSSKFALVPRQNKHRMSLYNVWSLKPGTVEVFHHKKTLSWCWPTFQHQQSWARIFDHIDF